MLLLDHDLRTRPGYPMSTVDCEKRRDIATDIWHRTSLLEIEWSDIEIQESHELRLPDKKS